MSKLHQMHWLVRDEDRALLPTLLLGDPLAFAGDREAGWFAPPPSGGVSGGARTVMLSYVGLRERLTFCFPAFADVDADGVRALRASASPARAEQIWGPFVERLGVVRERGADPWHEATIRWRGETLHVRRPHHGNFLIDLLMMRQRAEAARMAAAFHCHGGAPAPEWAASH